MSFNRVNPGGWSPGAKLTSVQQNQLDYDHTLALDKSLAGDTIAGVVSVGSAGTASGTVATITGTGPMTLGGLVGLSTGMVGLSIVTSGFANAGNNGTFPITAIGVTNGVPNGSLTCTNASAVFPDANSGAATWSIATPAGQIQALTGSTVNIQSGATFSSASGGTFTGPAGQPGLTCTGGSAHAGVVAQGTGTAAGVNATGGASNGNGVNGTGVGTGNGVNGTSGASSGGAGVNGTGVGTGNSGVNGLGAASGPGVFGQGGSGGAGVGAIGGAGAPGMQTQPGIGGTYPDALWAEGGVVHIDKNPAAATTDPGPNRLWASNIPKAWGSFVTNGSGGITLVAGHGIAVGSYSLNSSTQIILSLAEAMSGTSSYIVIANAFSVVAPAVYSAAGGAFVGPSTTQFVIAVSGAPSLSTTANVSVTFVVFGVQTG